MEPSGHPPDAQAQSDDGPPAAQTFRSDNSSQYPQQPQYQYGAPHHASAPPYSIDTDMGNMETFAASVQEATNSSNAVGDSKREGGSPRHVNATSNSGEASISSVLGVAGPSTPGMAPPQQGQGQGHRSSLGQLHGQQTPYSPTGPRASIDEAMDPSLTGGDPKRKRSKVSRACDECRRKKVRCDAAGDDGTIKTCTNCQKAGVICGYNRIPMKRGPSKGYIKELSERVQQVESQMAMSGPTSNFRNSMDANAPNAGYAEQTLYSPEDSMSFKRHFSFSDQQNQRSPFATSEYNRDRMPSVGWNAVSPHASGFRGSLSAADRHRGSVALAPDQQAPLPPPTTLNRPFWMSGDSDNPRPAKRLKMDTDKDEEDPPQVSQELLAKYYSEFHTNLPILPDADAAIDIVKKASPKIQHAFVAAVNALPTARIKSTAPKTNGETGTATTTPTIFKNREKLEDYLWTVARNNPESNSREDNLLLLWTYLLIAVEAENDLARLRDGHLSKVMVIKQAVDLGWSYITSESRKRQLSADNKSDGDQYTVYWARAWHCAGVLARLHALAVGSSNPMPMQLDTPLPNPPAVFPPTQAFLTLCSVALGSVINLVQNPIPPTPYGRQIEAVMRQDTMSNLDIVFSATQVSDDAGTRGHDIRMFYDLLLSRFTFLAAPFEILLPAADLAEALEKHTTASEEKTTYDPFSMHFFTLSTITLLEFTQDGVSGDMGKAAQEALTSIRTALEQISEKDHVEDERQGAASTKEPDLSNGTHPIESTTSTTAAAVTATAISAILSDAADQPTNDSAPTGTTKEDAPNDTPKRIHWADALLSMIERRSHSSLTARQNGTPTPTAITSNLQDTRSEWTVATDFSSLLKYGYLNVLAESVGL